MSSSNHNRPRSWTVAEAKARLSEILRLAEEEGPQRIGTRKPFVVMTEKQWQDQTKAPGPLGQWLVENVPRGVDLEIPQDRRSERDTPFVQEEAD